MEYRISTNILSICIIWLQIWILHTRVTPDFSFLSICIFSSWIMAIVIFVPLVPLKSGVTRVWRLQICNQIVQVDNIFVDIRYSIVWLNYFNINKLTPLGIPKNWKLSPKSMLTLRIWYICIFQSPSWNPT